MKLDRITGFCGIAPIEIFDAKGRPFYIKSRSTNRSGHVYFNLPAGEYITSCDLRTLRNPLKYISPKLPKPEYKRTLPELKLIIADNPRKCTVYFNTGVIKLDPIYADKPLPNLLHILFHELGHFLYHTEWKCDVFSCKQMLKFGFNPSQCLKTMLHNLNSDKRDTILRAEKNSQFLSKVKWQIR